MFPSDHKSTPHESKHSWAFALLRVGRIADVRERRRRFKIDQKCIEHHGKRRKVADTRDDIDDAFIAELRSGRLERCGRYEVIAQQLHRESVEDALVRILESGLTLLRYRID